MSGGTGVVLATERLVLRRINEDDSPFLLQLLNDESFLRFIGDRGVRTLEDASRYARTGPMASYERFGFGLWLATLKENDASIGICGLLKRDVLDDVDIGYALLPAYRAQGFAIEAVSATLSYARDVLALQRVVAVVNPDNASSRKLLDNAGMRLEGQVRLAPDTPMIDLFTLDLRGTLPEAASGMPDGNREQNTHNSPVTS